MFQWHIWSDSMDGKIVCTQGAIVCSEHA